MRRIAWDEGEVGHFEVDLVHHCGISTSGQYVHTIQMTDVSTGGSEIVANLGRSYLVMKDGFEYIMQRLPFPVKELHPENGSESLNDHILRFWGETIPGVALSRSRPPQTRTGTPIVRGFVVPGEMTSLPAPFWLRRLA
jgi:hypothetical protein